MPDKVKELADQWQSQTNSFIELAKKTMSEQPKGGKGKGAKGKGKAKAE